MNAKLIIPVIVAAFALSSCHVHHCPPQKHHNVYVNHSYRQAPPPKPHFKAKPKPKNRNMPPRHSNSRHWR